jgi:hypothetical protein
MPSSSSASSSGLIPIYLSDSSLDRYTMKTGTRVSDIVEHKAIPLHNILQDIQQQGETSDFYEFRSTFQNYEGEEVLFLRGPQNEFDYNYKFTANQEIFEDQQQIIKNSVKSKSSTDESGAEPANDWEEKEPASRGRSAQKSRIRRRVNEEENEEANESYLHASNQLHSTWTELSVSEEVELLHIKNHRPLLGFYISQPRYKFGKGNSQQAGTSNISNTHRESAVAQLDFNDVEPAEKSTEYGRQKIPGYSLNRSVIHMGFQAAEETLDQATQTAFHHKNNKATQSEPITFRPETLEKILSSTEFHDFLFKSEVLSLVEEELNKNICLDLFKDEFVQFKDEEVNLGNRAENALEVFHSFHHLKYSKNKSISAIQW